MHMYCSVFEIPEDEWAFAMLDSETTSPEMRTKYLAHPTTSISHTSKIVRLRRQTTPSVCRLFAAPHWPLQRDKETFNQYRGPYDDGPAKLRERRLERLTALRLMPKDVEPPPITGDMRP
jgi:arylsulfatase A-like enzyme